MGRGRGQLANPMNIMLLIVGVASFFIGQVATGLVVTALVTFNVLMATNQELKGRASVEAGAAPGASGPGSPVGSGRTDRIKTARAGRCGAQFPQGPKLPLARLRARGQLSELHYAELRFSHHEAIELVSRLAAVDAGRPSRGCGGASPAGGRLAFSWRPSWAGPSECSGAVIYPASGPRCKCWTTCSMRCWRPRSLRWLRS